jgi:phosphopantothenoylcysteine decarboxylase/phosphopantothenate--cysteine ligase
MDIVLMAAAVSDFRPTVCSPTKIKKGERRLNLELEVTPDILDEIGRQKGQRILVGFALETDQGMERATEKLKSKNLDLIVLNNPLEDGAGFGTETNIVTFIDCLGTIGNLPKMSKREIAERILDWVETFLKVHRSQKLHPQK